ncbi:hypothetical protein [Streptomyces sp. NPDC091217]
MAVQTFLDTGRRSVLGCFQGDGRNDCRCPQNAHRLRTPRRW